MSPCRTSERGMALVMACLVIVVVTILGSAMMAQTQAEHQIIRRYSSLSTAFQLAEAGADQVLVNLQEGIQDDLAAVEMSGGSYWADVDDLGSSLYRITSHGLVGTTQRDIEMVVAVGGIFTFAHSLFGETSVTLSTASTTDSYNSAEGDYDEDTAGDNGDIATNNTAASSITLGRNSAVNGQLIVGPGMEDPEDAVTLGTGVTISANPDVISADASLSLRAVNTGGLDCSGNLALPQNGTYTFDEAESPYCFNAITADIGSRIAVTGNVTVYADSVNFDKNFQVNTGGKPTQFLLGIYGDSDVVIDKDGTFVGALYAPGVRIHFKKDATVFGALAADQVQVDKTLTLHYDEDLQNYGPSVGSDLTIESWREL